MRWPDVAVSIEPLIAPRVGGPQLIADDAALRAALAGFGGVVGVDTEFMRVRTFYPVPALYQLAGGEGVVLVDGQAPMAFDALKMLLADPRRAKVAHSCSEDIEVMSAHLDIKPANLIDTQLAHAFLAPEFSLGYAAAVERYLGIPLVQHATRSDWMRRPLSDEQITYACEDAAYLVPIWERQREALARAGRIDWLCAEMRRMLDAEPPAPKAWYRTLKGIWRLDRRQLAVLRSLVAWREREARRRDLPRTWILPDEPLLAMSRRGRLSDGDIRALLPRRAAMRHAKALVDAHRAGLADDDPPPLAAKPLGRAAAETVRRLRTLGAEAAERLGIAPELLARKRDAESIYRHYRAHRTLPDWFDWREPLLGNAFRAALEAEA